MVDCEAIKGLINKKVKVFFIISTGELRIYNGYFIKVFDTSAEFIDKFNDKLILDLGRIEKIEVQK